MKWTTISSALCCVFGSIIFLGSLVLPSWRRGVGNWFLTDNPGVADWALFAYKSPGAGTRGRAAVEEGGLLSQ